MQIPVILIAILSALLFGAATPLSKNLLDHLTSFQLAGLLYIGAALGVAILVIRDKKFTWPWHMDRKNAFRLLGAVLFGGMLGPVLLLAGLRLANAASVSMWLNLEMVATAILGHFIFKDHLTKTGWMAAGGILLSAIILTSGEGSAGILAGILVTLACVSWGIDNHLTALIDGITPAQSTLWKGLVAGTTNLIIGVSIAPLTGSFGSVAGGLILGVFAYGFSIVLYITAAQQLGATRSQLIFSSAPFWGILLSILILGEKFTWQLAIAILLFVGSLLLLMREQHQHTHIHQGVTHDHPHRHDDGHHDHHEHAENSSWHTHLHQHDFLSHAHPHWPDLHHRHLHSQD
ncbi:MAG: EamA family transporter [Chloroflexi bacterium HGW-Chloroflexi-3]|nr:MAG: EamA family transporter [Chloroflexi bacterium HGW-Chloroflexi-3]